MPEHTPGPWALQKLPLGNDGEQEPSFRVSGETTLFLTVSPCSDGFVYGQNEANARLISAAPDLLAAMIEAEHWFTKYTDCHTSHVLCLSDMRAAIAKATGKDREVSP